MKVSVVGSEGRMGRLLSDILRSAGHKVRGFDTKKEKFVPSISGESDVVVLSVPVEAAVKYIERLWKSATVVEVSSVKKPLAYLSGKFVSIHPLFGPLSYPGNSNVCHITDLSMEGSHQILHELFPSCRILPMSMKEHEKLTSGTLVAPYVLSLIASNISPRDAVATRSSTLMNALASVLDNENIDVVMDTIRLNPNTPDILRQIEECIHYLRGA